MMLSEFSVKEFHELKSDMIKVLVFNVGQGDHILMKFPNNRYGIIDFHYDSGALKQEQPPALNYFQTLKRVFEDNPEMGKFNQMVEIQFVCISHTDKDHIKGAYKSIKWFKDNEMLIYDFWLGAAKDRAQYRKYLIEDRKLIAEKVFRAGARMTFQKEIEKYDCYSHSLFELIDDWALSKFGRRLALGLQNIVYLSDIKSLRNIGNGIEGICMGPLTSHLENYFKQFHLSEYLAMLKICDKVSSAHFHPHEGDTVFDDEGNVNRQYSIDKNQISHILRIRYDDNSIMFGGDTHLSIWLDCLEMYDNELDYNHRRQLGDYKSNLIKASHHGSLNSSDPVLWRKLLGVNSVVTISAGRNQKYKHPHPEVLGQIKQEGGSFQSTNICDQCAMSDVENGRFKGSILKFQNPTINVRSGKKPYERDTDMAIALAKGSCNSLNEGKQSKQEHLHFAGFLFHVSNQSHDAITTEMLFKSGAVLKNECFFGDRKADGTLRTECVALSEP